MEPIVSVIIPTFNRATWLTSAIESILNQSYQNFELLVVDDGSTDNTREIIAQYSGKIDYFYQTNRGPAAARNLGIKNAQGKTICFLDSDDQWEKQKLEQQMVLMMNQPETKICYTDEIWIRNGVRVNPKKIHRKYSGWIYQHCLPLCIISPSSVMIHRDVFDKTGVFDEEMKVCEDYDLWLRVSHFYPIHFIKELLIIKYGGHEDQLSRKYWGMDIYRIKAMQKMLEHYHLSPEDRKATILMLHKKCDILIHGFRKRNKPDQAKRFLEIKNKYAI